MRFDIFIHVKKSRMHRNKLFATRKQANAKGLTFCNLKTVSRTVLGEIEYLKQTKCFANKKVSTEQEKQ